MTSPNSESPTVLTHLRALQADYHDFNSSTVPILTEPTALQFSKIVAKGQPAVFGIYEAGHLANGLAPWRACSWDRADLESRVKQPVEVALTPRGNADALVRLTGDEEVGQPGGMGEKVFLQPATRNMPMSELLDNIHSSAGQAPSTEEPVLYLQSQNSNLEMGALSPLREDLPANFAFAEEVLGEPDARNIWIGDSRSVTSVHRDPYENLYLVLRGRKTFRLWAPVDEFTMPASMVRTGRYEYLDKASPEGGVFSVVMDEDNGQSTRIPWVDLDPLAPGFEDPGKMRQVTVSQGQMLYLPSGWYHHVSQECGLWDDGTPAPCIAVNYWYDMDYEGEKYVMRQLVGRLVEMVRNQTNGP